MILFLFRKLSRGCYWETLQSKPELSNSWLETDSKYIIIKCRDHEYVDGDRIKLLLNNIVIHPNITLTGSYYTIDIDLIEGYNNIEFVALNEGESSPNTAQLSVFDENGVNLSNNKWLITTGYKARLVVFKK